MHIEQSIDLERRAADHGALLVLVQQVHATVKDLEVKLTHHMTEETQELAQAITLLMNQSFPKGDGDGHRRHHEASIQAAEDRAAFWRTMRTEISKYGLLGFLGWALYALWAAFLLGPHK